jgi:hypothetical protein
MRGSYVVLTLALVVGACGGNQSLASDAGLDAPESDAQSDADVDAPASDAAGTDAPAPNLPSPYSISIGAPTIVANALMPRTVSITGLAGDDVIVALDRTSAGTVTPTMVTLDASGNGTASLTPCTDVSPGCVGPAALELVLASAPNILLARSELMLEAPAEVGEVAPCLTSGNVMYLHGNDFVYNGVLQTGPAEPWSVLATPDQIELDVGDTTRYRGIFSLIDVAEPLAPGIYEHGQRAGFAQPGHPGIEVISSGGCNAINGRFKVHDYTADPVIGTVYSVTISFEQVCDGMPGVLEGCFHYEAMAPTPVTCPALDPTMVSVQVLSSSRDGTPDLGATAIFTDSNGTVVVDTQVDACGQAQASLPSGGSLTTIENANGYEILHTYRGLTTGDHVVVNPGSATSGAQDLMLASFVPPTNANNMSLMTACGGGSWSSGTGPVTANLKFYDGCRTPTFDMLSIASFPNTQPHQFVWQTGLTHFPNGNVSVATSWAPMGTATVTLANVPPSSPQLGLHWSTKINATPVSMSSVGISSPAAGNQSVSMSYPPGAGDGAVVTVDTFTSLLSSESRTVVENGAPSSITVDFATQAIPLISAVQQTATGASWTETAGGAADVRTIFRRAQLPNVRVLWTLMEPYDGQPSTTMPALPAAHAAEDPTADPTAQLHGTAVIYVDYDVLPGFSLSPPNGAYTSHSSNAQTYNMLFAF